MESTVNSPSLRRKIRGLQRKNAHGQTYIPDLSLFQLITHEVVHAELKISKVQPYLQEELTRHITTSASKVFAILALIKEIRLVSDLIERNKLQDSSLPLQLEDLTDLGAAVALKFYETQWQFLAPWFTRSIISKSINPNCVLPFLKDERLEIGAFGTVYEICLDPQHQDLQDGFSRRLVRKELTHHDHSIELENLAILSHLKHPNIVELLGSYRYGERFNLVFPLAEGGNLATLFKREREHTPFRSDETFLIALAGLASALENVHDFFNKSLDLQLIGCHHDFQPKNILISEQKLILAGFRLFKFQEAGEEIKIVSEMGTGPFLAPECEDLDTFKKTEIGRSSDIWSFGCILVKILVYMADGPEGVYRFEKSRAFKRGNWTLTLFHYGSNPNPSVENCLSKLKGTGGRRNSDLVALIERMLSINEAERPKAKNVAASLRFVVISEVTESIDRLFEPTRAKEESLDVFLQLKRFDAWKHGFGLVDHNGAFTTDHSTALDDKTFNLTLQSLQKMRECLSSTYRNTEALTTAGIRELARLNDCLINVLDREQQDRTRKYFSLVVPESAFSEFIGQNHDGSSLQALDRDIRMRATLETITGLTTNRAVRDVGSRQIRPELIKDLKPFGNHHVGTFSGISGDQRVLVEWRMYDRQEADHVVNQELFTQLERFTDLMSMDKPEGFCSLQCQGFFHDLSRCGFGLVFDLPLQPSTEPKSGPTTLKSLINNTQPTMGQPTLEDKFHLASTLAIALLEFHLVGWLHKDLTSSNIIFCRQDAMLQSEMVREPYIIGFNHSHPDETAAFTEGHSSSSNDVYQHPRYRRDKQGYRQEYDYYSFGVVLLEIGLWRTIDEWTGQRNTSPEVVKQKLLFSLVPALGQFMGSSYRDAVRVCLAGDFGTIELPEDEKERKIALQLGFKRLVVDRLRNRDRWDQLEGLEVQEMETRKKMLGAKHLSTLTNMANLASTYSNQGRWDQAEELEAEVMETRERVPGAKHLETLAKAYVNSYSSQRNVSEKASESPQGEKNEQAYTDSSYASRTHEKLERTYSFSGKDRGEITEATEYTHQDSTFTGSQWGSDKQDVPTFGLYTAETIYSASENSALSPPRHRGYITELAAELFGTVKYFQLDRETLERISKMLPELLRAFALKLGHKAQTQMHRDVSFFVHKYRGRILVSFEDLFPLDDVTSSHVDRFQPGRFAISRYLKEPDFNMYHQTIELGDNNENHGDDPGPLVNCPDGFDSTSHFLEQDGNDDTLDEDTEPTPDASHYRDFIVETPAYSWLVASLQREAKLTRANPDVMESIRKTIFSGLPSPHIVSRKRPSTAYKATFELEWDPRGFIREQQYAESPGQALERAITLTGCSNDAQALTTEAYLCQTWPTTGKQVMWMVNDVVRRPEGHIVNSTLPDGTEISAQISEGKTSRRKFIVTAIGTADSIAETGQQFAWLGAALRSSPFDSGIAVCSPSVRNIRLGNTRTLSQPPLVEVFCNIDFEINELANGEALPGQCWHSMFRNPVMAKGYPILTKHAKGLGIEMPLNIIARLAGAERANEFDSRVFIKGFSAMLIATKITKDLLIWHYLYNRTGERISYLDNPLQISDDISLPQLDSVRHVVGWCSNCMYYAGAEDAQYNFEGSELPPVNAGCLLEKVTISGGKWLLVGATIAIGVKDVPPHLPPNGYIMKLRWLAKKYAVLWDDASKKGWLLNGTSALLHLVRAWLKFASKDPFAPRFLFDPKKMVNALNQHNPDSAIEVLINETNLKIPIYPGRNEEFQEEETKWKGNYPMPETEESMTLKRKKGYILFGDLVEHHLNILEQILEHQKHQAGQNGKRIKLQLRTHLEGWDFFDLATDRDPRPRIATLDAMGYGWVDFIRSIGAVVLLGCGFGDIIQPIMFDGMCPKWNSLPPDRYYLAASVYDLKEITREFGTSRTNPPEPVHGLVWHCPGDIVASCQGQCQSRGLSGRIREAFKSHNDPVQVFYPKRLHQFLRLGGPERLHGAGAVVFGHNVGWRYRWKEDGKDDLEEWHNPLRVLSDEDQVMPEPIDSSSESSTRANNLSVASGRSQSQKSSERTAATSLLIDSNANLPQTPTSVNTESSYSSIRGWLKRKCQVKQTQAAST